MLKRKVSIVSLSQQSIGLNLQICHYKLEDSYNYLYTLTSFTPLNALFNNSFNIFLTQTFTLSHTDTASERFKTILEKF